VDDAVPLSLLEQSGRTFSRRVQIKVDDTTDSFQIVSPEGMNHVQVFESFDQDRSGHIEEAEFKVALHSLGYEFTADGALKYFLSCDKDGSGAIDLDELDVAIAKGNKKNPIPPRLPGADPAKCVDAVNQIHAVFKETQADEAGLPKYLSDWCLSLSSSVSSQNPEARHAQLVWKEGCEAARVRLEEGAGAGGFDPKLFCSGMSKALGKNVEAEPGWTFKGPNGDTAPYAPPAATPSRKLSYLKDPRPCCKAHGLKGCHDKAIEQCVCAADSHCCDISWDLRCTEMIEKIRITGDHSILRCGRCEGPVDDVADLKDCLEGCG